MLQNKTRKRKVHCFASRKNNVRVQKYSKILPDLVILELISLNDWYVCCIGSNGSLKISALYQAVTQTEAKIKQVKKERNR